jgi:hypothetical protein
MGRGGADSGPAHAVSRVTWHGGLAALRT